MTCRSRSSRCHELKTGGAVLRRKFHLTAKDPPQGLYLLAASGAKIDAKSPGEWVVDGKTYRSNHARTAAAGQWSASRPAEAIDPAASSSIMAKRRSMLK